MGRLGNGELLYFNARGAMLIRSPETLTQLEET